jgi:hypothetical protein
MLGAFFNLPQHQGPAVNDTQVTKHDTDPNAWGTLVFPNIMRFQTFMFFQ